jgi:lysophospholipase L1-like esterase
VQGGHNDIGQTPAVVANRVRQLVAALHRAAPQTQLGLMSVFCLSNKVSRTALVLNHTIIAAARTADPSVLIFDPLTEHWVFPRQADHLHPSPAGHTWIAGRVAQDLHYANPHYDRSTLAGHH